MNSNSIQDSTEANSELVDQTSNFLVSPKANLSLAFLNAAGTAFHSYCLIDNLISGANYFAGIETPYAPILNGATALFCLSATIFSAFSWKKVKKKIQLAELQNTFS